MTDPSQPIADLLLLASVALPEHELHGLATGTVVANLESDPPAHAELVDRLRPGLCAMDSLTELCSAIHTQLTTTDLIFRPHLPNDEEPLESRVDALGTWVFCFIEAFEQSNPTKPQEIEEAMTDFGEIAQIESEVQNTDEMEARFTEIEEFVRIATMLIYEVMQQKQIDG